MCGTLSALIQRELANTAWNAQMEQSDIGCVIRDFGVWFRIAKGTTGKVGRHLSGELVSLELSEGVERSSGGSPARCAQVYT